MPGHHKIKEMQKDKTGRFTNATAWSCNTKAQDTNGNEEQHKVLIKEHYMVGHKMV